MKHADHAHAHGHEHGHGTAQASPARILATFWLITVFMAVEALGGWWAGSLTLMADAGHMLTDCATLALAWFAARAMLRPSDALRSYGHDRFSVLAALINGLALVAVVAWIAIEAVHRLMTPAPVKAIPMLAIACAGLTVNCGAFFALHGADRQNLNVRAALLHVVGDILASLAAVAAALVIIFTGWTPADPILSVLAGALILRSAVNLVGRSWRVLMESTPEDIDTIEIAGALRALEGVADIHHLHAWSLAPGKPLITLHALLAEGQSSDAVLARLKQALVTRFQIAHSTIQIEGACADRETHRGSAHDCGDRRGETGYSHARTI
jgi:cobalt-zinc-cadmium efflux system protein